MLYPSYRSSKILPVKLMRENEESDFSNNKTRSIMGKFLLISSIVLNCFRWICSKYWRYAGDSDINRIYISCFRSVCFISYLSFLDIKIMSTYDEKIFGRNTFVAIKNLIPQVRKIHLLS